MSKWKISKKRIKTISSAPSAPDKITYILSVLLTTLLCMSFTFMLTSTYEFDLEPIMFVILLVLMALGATALHARQSWKISLAVILAPPILAVLLVFLDIFDLSSGFEYFMAILKEYSFRSLETSFSRHNPGSSVFTMLMLMMNVLPVTVTTWVLTQRKNVIPALLTYVPFFGCSVALNYMFPAQTWCVLAFACVMILVIFQNTRKVDRVEAEKKLLLLMIPALALTISVGIVFPQENYDKQDVAVNQLKQIQKILPKLRNNVPDDVSQAVQNVVQQAQKTYMGSVIIENLANQSATIMAEEENLMMVGNFNPPVFRVMMIRRTKNANYRGAPFNERYQYIKTTSMDTYTGMSFSVSHKEPDLEHIYQDLSAQQQMESQFILQVTPKQMGNVNFIPNYCDNYVTSEGATSMKMDAVFTQDANIREQTSIQPGASFNFSINNVPVPISGNWSEEYLNDYIYDECLEVPNKTRDALLSSGLLPDWYMDLINGVTTMSDYDKVLAVTDYVRSLHPYDANTDFPPDDTEDFVLWFIRDCDTGFCVHYAITSVVLLRMIGVPARYVTGYMVNNVTNSQSADVYSTDAHAWFEFFSLEYGWIMGDSTPGNELASSGFDINAVLKYYSPDEQTTPTPTPASNTTNTPTPTRAPGATNTPKPDDPTEFPGFTPREHESNGKGFLNTRLVLILLGIFLLVAAIAVTKISYLFYWRKGFTRGPVRDRTRYLYRYANMMVRLMHGRTSRKMDVIGQKAAFSEEGVSQMEMETLQIMARRTIEGLLAKQKRPYRLLISAIFKVKI